MDDDIELAPHVGISENSQNVLAPPMWDESDFLGQRNAPLKKENHSPHSLICYFHHHTSSTRRLWHSIFGRGKCGRYDLDWGGIVAAAVAGLRVEITYPVAIGAVYVPESCTCY